MSKIFGAFIAYKIVKLLSTPWTDWDAFKLGLIDDKGKTLRKAKLPAENDAMNATNRLVKNIKKLIQRLPFGKTRLGSLAASLFLLKEELGVQNNEDYEIEIQKYINIPNSMLLEDTKIDILPQGKYVNIETNSMYYIKEEKQPDVVYMNVSLFKLRNLKTKDIDIVSEDDIRRV